MSCTNTLAVCRDDRKTTAMKESAAMAMSCPCLIAGPHTHPGLLVVTIASLACGTDTGGGGTP